MNLLRGDNNIKYLVFSAKLCIFYVIFSLNLLMVQQDVYHPLSHFANEKAEAQKV